MNIDIENMSKKDLCNKKMIGEIFNKYHNDELELDRVCNELLDRAKKFSVSEDENNSEDSVVDIVKGYILDFLELDRRKKEAVENKNERLQWKLELRKRKNAEEKKRREKIQKRELDKYEKEEIERARRQEYEEILKGFENALDTETGKDIIEKRFVYKKDGSLDGKSIVNYDLIIQNDTFIKEHVRFNLFTNSLEYDGELFTNGDLLNILSYIDRVYSLRDQNLVWNALNRPGNVTSYHPIKDIIEDKEWDKTPRIDKFFEKVCHVVIKDESTRKYYREVARMLFYGGIKRLYEPGCKFDYMIILKGKQGSCKTTLVRWLALDDSAYSEVTTIDGATGVELIKGSWICEFAELLAIMRAREVEGIKAFLTRQYDKYRPPYARVPETIPRSCIFIGTTNEIQFMSDMTGNRRYLPVDVQTDPVEFFEKEDEIKDYILECWREAFYKYMDNNIYTTIPVEYSGIVENMRSYYVDDNPIEGLVKGYLDTLPVGYDICGLEIFIKCFNGVRNKFSAHDSRMIAVIMSKYPNWVRYNERKSFVEQGYGQQRYWKKVSDD